MWMIRCIVVTSLTMLVWACSGTGEGVTPHVTKITESVYASAEVQPDSLYQAYAVVSGIVDEVMVNEGKEVKEGDPLVRIISEAPELNRANAQLVLMKAEADRYEANGALGDLKNQIVTAKLQREDDSINYQRQSRLWERNIGSRSEYERKKLAYEVSTNRLNNLNSAYSTLERDLEIAYQQAEINLKVAELNTGDYTVRSRINGRVYTIEKEVGEKVSIQEPLALLGSSDRFIVELLIDERDIGRIKPGQQIILSLEAFPNEVFTAKLTKIYPKKNERNQTFLVEAEFLDAVPDNLYAGLSGEANIVINQRDKVLTIPSEYVTEDGYVNTQNGLVKVETGLQGLNLVEIMGGIDENTVIYLPND